MNLSQTQILEIPPGAQYWRIQLLKRRRSSTGRNGLKVAPPGRTGRFSLAEVPCAYLADSPLTSLYESRFRRESRSCSLRALAAREMVAVETKHPLRLAALRGAEETYTFLHSASYELSQRLADDFRAAGLDGVLYGSAQHPGHACLCVFEPAFASLSCVAAAPLVHRESGALLEVVATAAERSGVPIVA